MNDILLAILSGDWSMVGYTILALVAGFLGHAIQEEESGRKFNWRKAVIQSAASGLVGFLIGNICLAMGFSFMVTIPIVGFFGFLGAAASMGVIKRFAYSKLGIPEDNEK